MTFAPSLANTILSQQFYNRDTWLALHTTSPLAGGLADGEISYAGYARQLVRWSAPVNRTVYNLGDVAFTGLPMATLPFLSVWSLRDGGELLVELDTEDDPFLTNTNGSTIYIPAESLVIELL